MIVFKLNLELKRFKHILTDLKRRIFSMARHIFAKYQLIKIFRLFKKIKVESSSTLSDDTY